jgi:hypothetical protein
MTIANEIPFFFTNWLQLRFGCLKARGWILSNFPGAIQNAENVASPEANDFIARAPQPPKPNRLITPRLHCLQFVQTPNGIVKFLPDRHNFARLAVRALSNGRACCLVPLPVLNKTVKLFQQCRDLRIKRTFQFI